MDEQDQIRQYYEETDEWARLERHRTEFAVTTHYLDRFIPQGARVLDIGGGPGRYALHLTGRGCRVVLLDLVEKHTRIAGAKAAEAGVQLERTVCGDALRLPDYDLGTFDAVLLMGPLYHLVRLEDRQTALQQALGVLRPGGILAASFISAYAPLLDLLKHAPEQLHSADEVLRYFRSGANQPQEGFTTAWFSTPQEAQALLAEAGVQPLAFAGVEGLPCIREPAVQALPESVFQEYLTVVEQLAEDPATFGSCEHYLAIGRRTA